MAIIAQSRWKGNAEYQVLAKEAAVIAKKHGAISLRAGRCFSGEYTGQVVVSAAFPDWETYGRAMQALSTDAEWQRVFAEASKISELQDRSLIVDENF